MKGLLQEGVAPTGVDWDTGARTTRGRLSTWGSHSIDRP
jgi:hypothetical protein